MGKTRNTGFSNNAIQYNSGSIAFVSGSTTRMFISASGLVGMGTTAPSYSLDVVASSGFIVSKFKSSYSASAFIGTDNTQAWFGQGSAATNGGNTAYFVNDSTGTALIQTSGSVKVTINASGSVGIGTSNPVTKLEVADANGIPLRIGDVSTSPINQTAGYIGLSTSAYSGINGDLVLIPRANASARILLLSGSVGMGTITTSTEANLFLGAQGASEGGQLVLQKATSYASASHIDNYQDYLRIMSGTDVGSNTVRMVVGMANGYVGINNTTPLDRFVVDGGNNIWTGVFRGTTTTAQSFGVQIFAGTNSSDTAFRVLNGATTSTLFLIRGDGYLQSPTTYNNTTANAANVSISSSGFLERSTSSRKYKKDIINYNKGLAEILQMRPVFYKGISENDGDKQHAGLIAEEIHDLGLTEFVQYAEDGSPDALSYQNMVALLTKAIQELKAENDALKTRIETLENK